MNSVLNGHNPEERVVAIQQLNDQTIRLFKRVEGKILQQDVEFFPFFFLSDESLIRDFPKKFWLKELAGTNFYRYIAAFPRWSEMWEAVHFILKQYNKVRAPHVSSYQELKEILVRPDAVRQFLLQSGITLYKGMKFHELVRLHIDIQTASLKDKKRKTKVQEEKILSIALGASDGNKLFLSAAKSSEQKILNRCIEFINRIDPDLIDGFDLFGAILPALNRACERQQVPFSIGRDGSTVRIPNGFGGMPSGESDWFSFEVSGRHLIDLQTLAESELGIKRTEQSLPLAAFARHLNIPVPAGQPNAPSKIADEWSRNPKAVEHASQNNASMTAGLSDLLLPPLFFLAQMCPLNYRMLAHLSPASRIESLLLREYVRQKHSLPRPSERTRPIITPSGVFYTGVFSNVLFVEIEGLYSSILLQQQRGPKTDSLNIFLSLLTHLVALRNELTERKEKGLSEEVELVSYHRTVQNLIQSFYLYLSSPKGLLNDPDQAEAVFSASQEILKEIFHQSELYNALIIQFDGTGFSLALPDNILGETNCTNFIHRLNNTLPKGIQLVIKNRYSRMLSYRRNNYAVLDHQNNVVIKGNGLLSRSMERYLKVFLRRCIECILTHDLNRFHHTYASASTQILQHRWTPADFSKIELTRMDSETYQNDPVIRRSSPSPAIEAAMRSSLFVKANTKIAYYFTGTGSDADPIQDSRLAEEWNPNEPDENTGYYLSRLRDAAQKFRDFFEPSGFERILSLDDIFGFSDEGIQILRHTVTPEAAENKSEPEGYGIWLADEE